MGQMELEVKILNVDKYEFIQKIEALGAKFVENSHQVAYTYDLPTLYSRYIDLLTQLNYPESDLKFETAISKLKLLFFEFDNFLNTEQKDILNGMKNIYIIGGTGAISESYENELTEYGKVERVYGSSRYDTSVAVANTFFDDVDAAVVASGKNFPDGLCGGPLAAAMGAPLILTTDGKTEAARDYVQEEEIAKGYVLGGIGALSDAAVIDIFGLRSED